MLNIKKTTQFIFITSFITCTTILLSSCAETIPATTETTIKTELQEVDKPVEKLMEEVENITPIAQSLTTDELITNALLKHYNEQFGNTNAKYKTTGYKMYLVEDISPKEKRAYGFANYMEYDLNDGKIENTAGSGPTGIVVTFSTDGNSSNVDYEILTESDYKSDKFKESFPEDIQKKILERNENDIAEVEKKQEDMLEKLMK